VSIDGTLQTQYRPIYSNYVNIEENEFAIVLNSLTGRAIWLNKRVALATVLPL
jgi:hypothetical protein